MMDFFKNFFLLLLLMILLSCSKDDRVTILEEKDLDQQMIELYNEAYDEFLNGDTLYAAKKFNEAELIFPQSDWAPIAALMSAYVYYSDDYYSDAIYELERFLKVYPIHKDIDYAHFLLAMCYYENIVDEKRDLNPLLKSKREFEFIIQEYPNTDFALDAKFKLDLIKDIMASKEMYLGRHYLKKQKWIPAIKRFQNVIENYDQTIFVEEAIHRLVEINYQIGLLEESQKYANLLGYNYLSSEWYKKSYKIFNKDYSLKKKSLKKEKKGVIKRFKKLFD